MFRLDDNDSKLINQLLTPSWLSGLVAVMIGLTISVGVIVTFELNNSALQQQLIAWQSTKPPRALTQPGQLLPENDKPSLKGSWPLLIFWSAAGLVVYAVATSIIRNLTRAEAMRESLDYVNAQPARTLAESAEHLFLRLIATILMLVLGIVFIRQVVPYSITAAHASAADVFSVDGLLYAVLAFALIVVTLHGLTILLRLSFGRARVFN